MVGVCPLVCLSIPPSCHPFVCLSGPFRTIISATNHDIAFIFIRKDHYFPSELECRCELGRSPIHAIIASFHATLEMVKYIQCSAEVSIKVHSPYTPERSYSAIIFITFLQRFYSESYFHYFQLRVMMEFGSIGAGDSISGIPTSPSGFCRVDCSCIHPVEKNIMF